MDIFTQLTKTDVIVSPANEPLKGQCRQTLEDRRRLVETGAGRFSARPPPLIWLRCRCGWLLSNSADQRADSTGPADNTGARLLYRHDMIYGLQQIM